jgi:hypothetical protein
LYNTVVIGQKERSKGREGRLLYIYRGGGVVCPDVIFKLWIYDTWKIDLSLEFRESGGE